MTINKELVNGCLRTALLPLVIVVLFSNQSHANVSSVLTWAKIFNGPIPYNLSGKKMQQTSDGGYIISGQNRNWIAKEDMALLRLNVNGDLDWGKAYVGPEADILNSVHQTADGGFIVLGLTESFIPLQNGSGHTWALKTNSTGDIVWQNIYTDAYCFGVGLDILQTSESGYIILNSCGYGASSLLKIDAEGTIEWQKAYMVSAGLILQSADGGYLLAGDGKLLKVNSQGDSEWQKSYVINGSYVAITGLNLTADGAYILSGIIGYTGAYDSCVLKLDVNGNIIWQKSYVSSKEDRFHVIQQTADGGYIVAGYTTSFGLGQSDALILKLDSDGNIIWQKTYGGDSWETTPAVQQTSDGGFIFSVVSYSFGYGNLILKLDNDGNVSDCTGDIKHDSFLVANNISTTVSDIITSGFSPGYQRHITDAIVSDIITTATTVCQAPRPDISVSPSYLNFDSVELGYSLVRLLTVANTGNAELAINDINIFGSNMSNFHQENNCSIVPAGGSCIITVTFLPASLGSMNATLKILSNSAKTLELQLSGVGIDTVAPNISLSTSVSILWPPNHDLVDVVVYGSSSDTGSGIASIVISVTDEYGIFNMIVPQFGDKIQLDAWRDGSDSDGRHYTITAVATDKAANKSIATTTVTVPNHIY